MCTLGRRTCNVCESEDGRVVASLLSELDGREYGAVVCKQCGLVYASPVPELSLEALQYVYGERYTEGQRKASSNEQRDRALRHATNRQMDLVEAHVAIGTALNIGAMSSAIKVLEERGWRLCSVEASRYAAETARRLWGLDVTVSRIEDFECPPDTFEFIKLGHVIEHLADPTFAIRRLVNMLKPGGVMLIDTDNARGLRTWVEVTARRFLGEDLSAKLVRRLAGKNLRKRYGRLTPPEHLYCFSEESLTRLLQGSGLDIIQCLKPAWGDVTWFPLIDGDEFSRPERAFIILDQAAAKFGVGEVLVVLARKP